ncbi:hypothetical protein N431DRAFT_429230 [Stipitochalara longipes BDJ]|nr:hypothetical protein N431DRAFT_429230 [Stipitochalara longipes BDJ]
MDGKEASDRQDEITPRLPLRELNLASSELIDWTALCSCIVLLISSVLLIANGSCSSPRGLSANSALCVGGQLSIQEWLAIVGVEFSVTCSVLLPRTLSTKVSKSLTSASIGNGVRLDKVLNSQRTAPIATQWGQGWRKYFFARLLVAFVVILVTILYKFTFVLVSRHDSVLVSAEWIEMGSSLQPLENGCPAHDNWFPDGSFSSNNLRDLVSGTNNSILYKNPGWTANATSGPTTLYVGPGINITSVPQLLKGTVSRCEPAHYFKFTLSTSPAPSSLPQVDLPLSNYMLSSGAGNLSYINFAAASDSNQTLQIIPVESNPTIPDGGGHPVWGPATFAFMTTVLSQDCLGNFTWNNAAGYQTFQIQEPVDEFCVDFDWYWLLYYWKDSSSFLFTTGVMQAYFAGRSLNSQQSWDPTRAIEIMLLSLPVTNSPNPPPPGTMMPSNPTLKGLCDAHNTNGPFAHPMTSNCWFSPLGLISGTINSHGVGMTALGIALQCFVLLSSLVAFYVILGPGVPILTEWPAQWIGLGANLPAEVVGDAVARTSTGRSHATGQTTVFLSTVRRQRGDQEKPYLRFLTTQGSEGWTART